jgi:hypothetical protein
MPYFAWVPSAVVSHLYLYSTHDSRDLQARVVVMRWGGCMEQGIAPAFGRARDRLEICNQTRVAAKKGSATSQTSP